MYKKAYGEVKEKKRNTEMIKKEIEGTREERKTYLRQECSRSDIPRIIACVTVHHTDLDRVK